MDIKILNKKLRMVTWGILGLLGIFTFIVLISVRSPGGGKGTFKRALTEEETAVAKNLQRHVTALSEHIGVRNQFIGNSLDDAQAYITLALKNQGYRPKVQEYLAQGKFVQNISVEIKGDYLSKKSEQIIVIGAHYDTVVHSPGADDNASGVAAVLELAQMLRDSSPKRTIRLAFYTNEESPYFRTGEMGSYIAARHDRETKQSIYAMLSVETIGYYFSEPNSQTYPFPLGYIFPEQGNFIAFVSNLSSRGLLQRTLRAFRRNSDFPSEGATLPSNVEGVDYSDHWGYWQEGYKAIMITDTAPFRYPYYHAKDDTPDKLDYGSMSRVVLGLRHVVESLASN